MTGFSMVYHMVKPQRHTQKILVKYVEAIRFGVPFWRFFDIK